MIQPVVSLKRIWFLSRPRRLGDVLNLTWSDADFEESRVRVVCKTASDRRAAWTPKDKDMRIVALPDQAVGVLAELQA